jgi:putative hydrolase of the HAD superfamily
VTAGSYAAVVFDLDDTLIEEEGTARRSLRRAAQLVPGHDPDRVVEVVLATARRIWRGSPYHAVALDLGIGSWEALWSSLEGGAPVLDGLREWGRTYSTRVWQEVVSELGSPDPELARQLDLAYRREQWDGHDAFEGVPGFLSDLRRQARIGLLTNGPPDIQRRKLAHSGLEDAFDTVVISGEVGVGKPSPAVFELVRAGLGVSGPLLMVGDSWERDVLGALGAGWSAVWVSDGRPAPDAQVPVVNGVADLRESLLGSPE